jgi:hypothetical protein
VCQGSCLYQGIERQELSPSKKLQYRNETLHSDCNNSQGNVGKLCRCKTQTTCAIENGSICPFQMSIGFDGIGYYLVGGTGNSHLAYHPKVMKVEFCKCRIQQVLLVVSANLTEISHKGEGLVTQQWNLHNNYISQRVRVEHWLVSAKRAENTVTSELVPHSLQVRKVSILDDRILRRSCMHFERIGIPC